MSEPAAQVPEVIIDVSALPRIEPLSYEVADPETREEWDRIAAGPGTGTGPAPGGVGPMTNGSTTP